MTSVDELFTLSVLISFTTLVLMELALGIDNVVFVSLMLGHMPQKDRARGRRLWLVSGILVRSSLLIGFIALLSNGEATLFAIAGHAFSVRHLILILAGAFLLYRAVKDIRLRMEGERRKAPTGLKAEGFGAVMLQVVLLDAVLSFDSVLTAIGLGANLEVMILAVVVAMIAMFYFAKSISAFIERNPTFKILALCFLGVVGFMLAFEGLEPLHHSKIPIGYAYAAMAFSFGVELLNMRMRKKNGKEAEG